MSDGAITAARLDTLQECLENCMLRHLPQHLHEIIRRRTREFMQGPYHRTSPRYQHFIGANEFSYHSANQEVVLLPAIKDDFNPSGMVSLDTSTRNVHNGNGLHTNLGFQRTNQSRWKEWRGSVSPISQQQFHGWFSFQDFNLMQMPPSPDYLWGRSTSDVHLTADYWISWPTFGTDAPQPDAPPAEITEAVRTPSGVKRPTAWQTAFDQCVEECGQEWQRKCNRLWKLSGPSTSSGSTGPLISSRTPPWMIPPTTGTMEFQQDMAALAQEFLNCLDECADKHWPPGGSPNVLAMWRDRLSSLINRGRAAPADGTNCADGLGFPDEAPHPYGGLRLIQNGYLQ